MAQRLANDITVVIIYAYMDELANHLVSEASKHENTPYVSNHGHLMDLVTRYGGGSLGTDNEA
jgi:hypothetical protein